MKARVKTRVLPCPHQPPTSCLVALGVPVQPWAIETVLSALVGDWWGQGIARAFTRCMINIYIYIYIYIYEVKWNFFEAVSVSVLLYRCITWTLTKRIEGGCPRGVMVKAMDCGIVVSEFVFQSHYYVHFRANTLGKCMNLLILPAMG